MASLPKPDPNFDWIPMSIEELFAIRGTPEFDIEYRRQRKALAEHNRQNQNRERIEPDWEYLDKVWK